MARQSSAYRFWGCVLPLAASLALAGAPAGAQAPVHGIALHGDTQYAADFTHFNYVNPDAPKGGALRMASPAPFDTLNPFTIKGVAAPGATMVFDTLLASSEDEPFTEYGLIAESIEMPEDRSSVTFNLRRAATFHDGKPVTAEDVVWTFRTLMEKGHPFYRAYYAAVGKTTVENAHRVRFDFKMAGNRELPMIIGQMPVLPKHAWADKDFSATTLEPLTGSGPYRAVSVDPGRRITYERVKDWWAKDLPVAKGHYNFDTITYEIFRDETVLLQAFFSGAYDIRVENIAKAWNSEYNGQRAVRDGSIVKVEIPHDLPVGMQGYVMNTRRPQFADRLTRQALNYAFDFEWANRQFAHGAYKRTASYFENSDMAARGLPSDAELAILEPFRAQLPEEVFTTPFENPKTSGSGKDLRANLTKARALLEEAGWKPGRDGMLMRDGKPFRFEFLVDSDAFQRWTNPMIANLKRLGIAATLRVVDAAQYQNRMDNFDFDVTVRTFPQSLSPGNEQLDFWGSDKADVAGSRNIIGIKDPVVDALIGKITLAADREELVNLARALDRVLLAGHYVVPHWHIDYHRIAYWNKFGRPAVAPKYGFGIPATWWFDAGKARAIETRTRGKDKE